MEMRNAMKVMISWLVYIEELTLVSINGDLRQRSPECIQVMPPLEIRMSQDMSACLDL